MGSDNPCTACEGTGKIPKTGGGKTTCPNCKGSGKAPTDPRD